MTSIKWMVEQIIRKNPIITQFLPNYNFDKEIIEQSKEMHKQEIIDAFKKGQALGFDDNPNYMAEQYYQETYGNKDSKTEPLNIDNFLKSFD